MHSSRAADAPAVYQIWVLGRLDPNWTDWFDGFTLNFQDDRTQLVGEVPDQAALLGLLARIGQLNLTLLKVERQED